ncbi:MAG: AbrB/MazE/SpoVT family DNA-binding domain-containing protein [archaeon]
MIIKREIGEKGQVVIPKDIRNHLGFDIGVKITFEVEDDKIILRKQEDAEKIVEDFFDTPKISKKISVKELKKVFEEQYG